MVQIEINLGVDSQVTKVLAILGFHTTIIGLLSYWLKERLFISEPALLTILGIIVGPACLNWVDPLDWTGRDPAARDALTFQIVRIVIGIQVLFAGISLPKAYIWRARTSLLIILLPVMGIAWMVTAGLIYAVIPQLNFLEALVIGACATPTDPVLSNSIVKGRFAEEHISPRVRDFILAESGANDGLGYPFIFISLFLLRIRNIYVPNTIGQAIYMWIVETLVYQILLACVLGAIIGYVARVSLKAAKQHGLIDSESFFAYGIGLAWFTMGVVGALGSDDLLACFIAGNFFSWDAFFNKQTADDSFQAVIDGLINVGVFVYFGTILPWSDFATVGVGHLVGVTILILFLRRPPWILCLYKTMDELQSVRDALFCGWFGPIGVGAMYYVQIGLQELPVDRLHTREMIAPITYFLILGSIFAHGITIPIIMFAPRIPKLGRTLSFHRTSSTLPSSTHKQPRSSSIFSRPPEYPAIANGADPERGVAVNDTDRTTRSNGSVASFDQAAQEEHEQPRDEEEGSGSGSMRVMEERPIQSPSPVYVTRGAQLSRADQQQPQESVGTLGSKGVTFEVPNTPKVPNTTNTPNATLP